MIGSNQRPGELNFSRPFLSLLFFSVILFFSLAPIVYSGDSGLFTAASFFLGSAHPPGYPLIVLLGKVLTFLPLGNIAFKVNLLSAVFGALAALLAYQISFYVTKNSFVSILSPLVILTSPNFILESSKAEVYTLNTFLVLVIFYLCLLALMESDFVRPVLLSSFVLGIGMGNHHTIFLMLFPLIYVAIARRKDLTLLIILSAVLLFFAGFSVHFHLYLRSIADGFITYSKVLSVNDFLSILLRKGYQISSVEAVQALPASYAAWFYGIKNFGIILSREIHPLLWFFSLAGLVAMFKFRKMFWCFLITLAIWLPLARLVIATNQPTSKDIFTVGPYFLQVIPFLGIMTSIGVNHIAGLTKNRLPLVSKAVVAASIVFLLVFIPVAIQKASLSDFFLPYTWIKDVSKVLKPKSFFFAFGDNPAFLPFYIFGVERLRDDILTMDGTPGLSNFRISLSPAWKFSQWYPDFYQSPVTSANYFSPIAEEGRLYASSISSIPDNIKEKFDVTLYVLVVILKPKGYNLHIDERFREDFIKIDYAASILSHKMDFMAEEIRLRYVNAILTYANLLSGDDEKDADFFYRLAMYVSNPEQKLHVMKLYIPFVIEKRGITEARKLLEELKRSEVSDKRIREIEEMDKDLNTSTNF